MRVVIQRVSKASVTIYKSEVREIGKGLVVLLGIEENDSMEDVEWLSGKIVRMRIFDDNLGVMNLSVGDIHGDILLISQFTLHASTKKGNRPSYIKAARPDSAIPLYNSFIVKLEDEVQKKITTGVFGAHMDVALVNDGPVTLIMDSKIRE